MSDPEFLLELAEAYTRRMRNGEHPATQEYTSKYPHLEREIGELLSIVALVENIGVSSEDPNSHQRTTKFSSPAPDEIGDYRIIREIGRGGMGVVYEAEQVSLGRRVAVKVLPAEMFSRPQSRQRFEREARAAARLHHTNIVPVFGFGEHNGVAYYVMQFIQGHGLDKVIRELKRTQHHTSHDSNEMRLSGDDTSRPERLELQWDHQLRTNFWQKIAGIGVQVADALRCAHDQGVVHRDIKPANLMLDLRGAAWVTDFGLAKATEQQDLTNSGDMLGTLRYMAPEQLDGRSDARSDIYSLGLTLYEVLAFRSAFDETAGQRLMKQVLTGTPPRLSSCDSQIPIDLATIVHKAIEREPSQRYQSAGELAGDLRRFLSDEPILAKRASWIRLGMRWCRKNPAIAALSSLLAVALVILSFSQFQILRERNRFRESLAESLLSQAQFRRLSGQAGQRIESLKNLEEAATIRVNDDLRVEAIRCLVLSDLHRVSEWPIGFSNFAVDGIAFTPTLSSYVAYTDGIVEVRETPPTGHSPGKVLNRLPIPKLLPHAAKFSPCGRFLGVCLDGSIQKELHVWEWECRKKLVVVNDVAERAFDIDSTGKFLICGVRTGDQWFLRVYGLADGQMLSARALPGMPFDMRFEPQGLRVAITIPSALQVLVIDAATSELLHEIDYGEDIYAVAWNPKADSLAVGRGFDVVITQLGMPPSTRFVLPGHTWVVHSVQFHPSGNFLASHSLREGTTRLWDLRKRRQILSTAGHAVRFDVSGAKLAMCHSTTASIMQLEGDDEYRTIASNDGDDFPTWRILHHPEYPLLFGCGRGGLACWDADNGQKLFVASTKEIFTITIDPETGELLTAGEAGLARRAISFDRNAHSVELGDPQPVKFGDAETELPKGAAYSLQCSRDGNVRAASFRGEKVLYVYFKRQDRLERLSCDPKTAFLSISPDGRWVASGNFQWPGFHVWDLQAAPGVGSKVLDVTGSAAQVAFSPDDRLLVACANDRYAVFDVGTWKKQFEVPTLKVVEGAAAFSTDSSLLAVTMAPGEIHLLNSADGRMVMRLDSQQDQINVLNLHFFSQRLYLACGPGGTRVWDLAALRNSLRQRGLDW